jgi:hypothetical protein
MKIISFRHFECRISRQYLQISRLPLFPCQLLVVLDSLRRLKMKLIHSYLNLACILHLLRQLRALLQYGFQYL